MTLKTSAIGRAVLTAREGCKLTAYLDSQSIATIGTGHTGRASPPPVHLGMTITAAEADAYLAADLAPMEAAVNKVVTVALTDHEFDSLVSFCFNIGVPGFEGSTVVKRLNAGDRQGAADAFSMWEKPASLISRREAERAQFLTSYSKAMPVPRIGESAVARPAPSVPSLGPITLPLVLTPSPNTPAPTLNWFQRAWIALTFRKAA